MECSGWNRLCLSWAGRARLGERRTAIGGFLGIGGSSAKTDRSTTLKGYGALENVFNFGIPAAKNLVSAGGDALSQAMGYYSSLLSGNRSALSAATAPEANATRAAADAAKRQLATSGTARGGGTAGVNQQVSSATEADINNAMFGARSEAAKSQGSLGLGTTNAGTSLLDTSEKSAADLTDAAIKSRPESYDENLATQKNVVNSIIDLFGKVF